MRPAAIALVVGLALGNLLLGCAWLSARDVATAVRQELAGMQQQRDGAQAAASACSDAVDDLRTLADKRAREAEQARAQAAGQAKVLEQRADKTLSTAPAVPGDMCASMQALGDEWLRGRTKP